MIDEKKVKILVWAALAGIVLFFLLILGFFLKGSSTSKRTSNDLDNGLRKEKVTAFLKAYFNKDKVGTNRKDYQPYLTDGAYQEEIGKEESPAFQAYTSYMQNYQYKSAKLYFGSEEPVVFATVSYQFDSVNQLKENEKQKKITSTANYSLKLTYKQTEGKWLVDKIEIVNLNPISESGQEQDEYAPGVIDLNKMNGEENNE